MPAIRAISTSGRSRWVRSVRKPSLRASIKQLAAGVLLCVGLQVGPPRLNWHPEHVLRQLLVAVFKNSIRHLPPSCVVDNPRIRDTIAHAPGLSDTSRYPEAQGDITRSP